MNLILKPEQVDLYNIRYIYKNNNINIIYKDIFFTLNSMYILVKLYSNKLNKQIYINKSDLSKLINLEYIVLQNNKHKFPVYTIKNQIYDKIKTSQLKYLYINITGIWENDTQCGVICTIN
jgi:hypothetical protein